jgi:hypothetical protein
MSDRERYTSDAFVAGLGTGRHFVAEALPWNCGRANQGPGRELTPS